MRGTEVGAIRVMARCRVVAVDIYTALLELLPNPNVAVQPIVTYDPATGSPLGEGETEVVTVTNNYENVNLLGIAVNLVPKFTG